MAKRNQILIIDDDEAMCQLLKKLFERDYDVVTKNNGMAAMYWLVAGNIPDLIITDLDMPNLMVKNLSSILKKAAITKRCLSSLLPDITIRSKSSGI
ncbi:MAG: response regulator [Cyclobacteriaceae bacterium]|nr:response regulator [Cyclobacteriaceae bacterium]